MNHTIIWLGGNVERGHVAAKLAQKYPNSRIVISSENSPLKCWDLLQSYGIERGRVIFDYKAWDTVTNFTNTFDLVKSLKTDILHIVTDDFHMRRAFNVARVVYALRDTDLQKHPRQTTDTRVETLSKVISDCIRALVWRITGNVSKGKTYYSRLDYFKKQEEIAKNL